MHVKVVWLIGIYLLCSCTIQIARARKDRVLGDVRLTPDVRPEYYKLSILTYLNDEKSPFEFTGEVLIRVKVYNNTKRIRLHAKELNIDNATIKVAHLKDDNTTGDSLKILKIGPENLNDFYTIDLAEDLIAPNKYCIHIPFNAKLNPGLQGYYRSSYVDSKSKQRRWLAVTQFEPTHARNAFPCFDEPVMKARFEISLGHHTNYTALSNMPIRKTEPLANMDGWVIDHFEESVPMSTYLVAYIIHDFASKESKVKLRDRSDVIFKNWVRRDAISQIDYASWAGPAVLKFFEDYFSIKYPLAKMDMIAIPDFSAGAMENWGLVTYRETALLYHQNVSSSKTKARVAGVIAHELAHQWFGNLVTMDWWDDLWLNEGFATYVASLGLRHLHPEWNSFDEDSLDNLLSIFEFDSLKSSHPISVQVSHPDEILQIFDFISYRKGSSVIRMMHLFLGEEAFREGVTNYLKEFQYRNAKQNDLWHSLTLAGHKHEVIPQDTTVQKIMDTWTLRTGYPIIRIERDYAASTVTITQRRYLSLNKISEPDTEACWWIPLSFTTCEEVDFNTTIPKEWIGCTDAGAKIPLTIQDMPESDTWILFNIGLSSLYKVDYDDRNWRLLIDYLKGPDFKQIGVMNRAQLVSDALDLAWSGEHKDYNVALNMASYLKQEDEYIPWKAVLQKMTFVKRVLARTPEYGRFKTYVQKIINPIFIKLGGLNANRKAGDRDDIVKFKVLISGWACRVDIEECTEKAKTLFAQWKKHPKENKIPSDLRSIVYCTAIRLGDESDWDFLWQKYRQSNVPSEKQTIQYSLGCSREIWLLARYLDYSLVEDSGIRKQDCPDVFSSVAGNEIGFHLAKDFFEERIEDIYNYLDPDTSRLARYVKSLAHQMKTRREYSEFSNLIETKPKFFAEIEQSVKQAKELVQINAQWDDKNYRSIGRLLDEKAADF